MAINNAACEGNLERVKSLVEQGTNVNFADDAKWTPLMIASHYGHEGVVNFLLKKKANVNATNNEAATALMFAAINGHRKIVEILIFNRASVDLKNCLGETALWGASLHEHYGICELLLHSGANLWITNHKGWVVTGNYFDLRGNNLCERAVNRNKMFKEAYEMGQMQMTYRKVRSIRTIQQFILHCLYKPNGKFYRKISSRFIFGEITE